MADTVAALIGLLDLERLEDDLFRGQGAGGETSRRIYGGQVVAQALAAAARTVGGRLCHSLHAYFLRAGDPARPVIYEVDRARDGGSFTTRRVVAIQSGRQIFNMSASFHVEEPGFAHHHPMPQAPSPDTLMSREDERAALADRVAPDRRADVLRPSALEIRKTGAYDLTGSTPASDANAAWFRLSHPPAEPVPQWLQRCLLAYASDQLLLGSALRPHGESWYTGRVMTASLDHAIWFHGPVDFATWHLYQMDAPWSGGARGMNRGLIYDATGHLVATTAQEGLIRPIADR